MLDTEAEEFDVPDRRIAFLRGVLGASRASTGMPSLGTARKQFNRMIVASCCGRKKKIEECMCMSAQKSQSCC